MTNKALRQDIIDELEFEPSIDAAHVGVAVDNGVVTLTGHVPTYAQKAVTEEVVRHIKGVRGIAQEIDVRPLGSHETADDEIAKRALHSISWNTVIPDGAVQVRVQNGWVTLSGKVDWQYQKSAAFAAIRYLAGVLGVQNNVEVVPHATASNVKKSIEDALKRNAEVESQAIEVRVSDGKVMLKGKVKSWAERRMAERAAWAVAGVRMVEDQITIA